jgi:hypothetical protein
MAADRKARAAAAAEAAANDKLLVEMQGVFAVFDDDRSGCDAVALLTQVSLHKELHGC